MIRKLCALLVIPAFLASQQLSHPEAVKFVNALTAGNAPMQSLCDSASYSASVRLGIEYCGVTNKCLIGEDLPEDLKNRIEHENILNAIVIEPLDDWYSRMTVRSDSAHEEKEFYFRQGRYIPRLLYLTRNWKLYESAHFRFAVRDSSFLNQFCVDRLESCIATMSSRLKMTPEEMNLLRKNKIFYYLCSDEDEIERLTGFRTRGMYHLACDAVVSVFNAHLHELTHLMINYKLHKLPLYTHPLFQEGVAVAYGGRGGIEADVILPLGKMLCETGSIEFSSLFDRRAFNTMDASLSYPAAGLYSKFLIETIGIESYLKLYRKHSGTPGDVFLDRVAHDELPKDSLWRAYLRDFDTHRSIIPGAAPVNVATIYKDASVSITRDSMNYYFALSDTILLNSDEVSPRYRSTTFHSFFPEADYRGEMYLVAPGQNQISVYDLSTNSLIAVYSAGLSISGTTVPKVGGRYLFAVPQTVFKEAIRNVRGKSH